MNRVRQQFGGDWTEQKLICVGEYLNAYIAIMRLREYDYAYIDAFAGTGYRNENNYDDPAIQRFLAGSAQRALEVRHPFPNYIFIEADEHSFAELEKLKDEFPKHNIKCINREANISVKEICEEWNWRKNRALIFLDPFGMQVEWNTIELIAQTKAIDLWLLFPIGMGVNRSLYNDGKIPESHQRKLDQLFGRSDWFNEFYQLAQQLPLFGDNAVEKKDDILIKIQEYYLRRLASVFHFVANNPLPLRNSKNSLMYLLCFAAGNPHAPKALKIAEDILHKMRHDQQLTLPF